MNNSKVIKAGLGYTIGNYLLKGLSFLTIPIFARLLSTDDYGIVNTFGAYESIMFVIIGLAIHTSFKNARYKFGIVSEGAEIGQDYRTYVSNAFSMIWLSGLIWLLFVIIFRSWMSQILKLSSFLVILLVFYSTSNAILTAYNSDVSIYYEYKKYVTIAGFNSGGNIFLSIIFILFIWPSKRYFGRIVGIVCPIICIAVFLTINQLKKTRPKNFKPMIKWGLKYSLPIVPHGISQIILSSFDRIMIRNMVSNSASGLYSFAYNIFAILQVTSDSINTVWNPWFYERRKDNNFDAIKNVSTLYMLFLFSFSSFIMLISPELVYILGGLNYKDSVICVIPIVCGGFFTFLYNIPATVEYYHERTKLVAMATICAATINVITNFIFIKKYGYVAAAYTTLATYFLYFLFHYFMAKRIEGKSLFHEKTIWFTTITIVGLAVITLLTIHVIWMRLILAVSILIAFLVYSEKKMNLLSVVIRKFWVR